MGSRIPTPRIMGSPLHTDCDLELHQLNRAVEILGDELDDHQMSPFQRHVHRLFNWTFVVVIVGYVVVAVVTFILIEGKGFSDVEAALPASWMLLTVGFVVASLGLFLMVVLFLLSLGLVRKLWSMARARRRLGLTEPLAPAFKARRREHLFRNLVTGAIVVFGVLFIFGSLIKVGLEPSLMTFGIFLFNLLIGFSFGSLHFIRRGIERHAIVEELDAELRMAASRLADDPAEAVKIDELTYDIIASLERHQIIQQRHESIRRAAEDPDAFGYALYMSFAAQEAKDRLPLDEKNLVDQQILQLLSGPKSSGDRAKFDADGDMRRLPVKGTSVEIRFRVDETSQRIQIAQILSRSFNRDDPSVRG